mgnify:CR=1 FL=1
MALSDVLQLDCSMDNQIARNATKNFAGMLGKAFEQYKSKYISLIIHCFYINKYSLCLYFFNYKKCITN